MALREVPERPKVPQPVLLALLRHLQLQRHLVL